MHEAYLPDRAVLALELRFGFEREHVRAGRFEQCVSASQSALKLAPESAEAYNNMGSAYAALGKWSDAIEAENSALKINPNFQIAKNNLAWAKSQQAQASRTP